MAQAQGKAVYLISQGEMRWHAIGKPIINEDPAGVFFLGVLFLCEQMDLWHEEDCHCIGCLKKNYDSHDWVCAGDSETRCDNCLHKNTDAMATTFCTGIPF